MYINESYLFLCIGKKFINDSIDLIDTLRHFDDNRKINIVVLPSDYQYALNLNLFDKIFIFEPEKEDLYNICKTDFEKFCILPRLKLYKFLSTEYTIILDVDILCSYYTNFVWDYLKSINQDFIMLGNKQNDNWHWGKWGEICRKINIKPQETSGGLFFIKKTNNIKNVFNEAKYCFENYEKLGMLKLYQDGAVDEPCFSYSFHKNNLSPVDYNDFPIMSFNINSSVILPINHQKTDPDKKNYVPFIHMFEKNETNNFKLLKQKILKYKNER